MWLHFSRSNYLSKTFRNNSFCHSFRVKLENKFSFNILFVNEIIATYSYFKNLRSCSKLLLRFVENFLSLSSTALQNFRGLDN